MAHQTKSPESLDLSRVSGGFMFLVSVCFEVKKFIKVQKSATKSRIKSRIKITCRQNKKSPMRSTHPGSWEVYLHGVGLIPPGTLRCWGEICIRPFRAAASFPDCGAPRRTPPLALDEQNAAGQIYRSGDRHINQCVADVAGDHGLHLFQAVLSLSDRIHTCARQRGQKENQGRRKNGKKHQKEYGEVTVYP